jgi:hypothetical protein
LKLAQADFHDLHDLLSDPSGATKTACEPRADVAADEHDAEIPSSTSMASNAPTWRVPQRGGGINRV